GYRAQCRQGRPRPLVSAPCPSPFRALTTHGRAWQASCASAWPLSLPPPTMAWRDGSIEAGQTADFSRRRAPRTKLAQAGRLGGLRKLAAVGTEQEFVVMVPGLRKAKERLQ